MCPSHKAVLVWFCEVIIGICLLVCTNKDRQSSSWRERQEQESVTEVQSSQKNKELRHREDIMRDEQVRDNKRINEREQWWKVWARAEVRKPERKWNGGMRGTQRSVCVCVCDWVETRLGRQYQTVHQCHRACVLCKPFHPSAWKAWLCDEGSSSLFTYSTLWYSNPFL